MKILKSATTFAGVNYNEKKNEQGKSELLVAKNFPLYGEISKSDYISYMEAVSNTNPNVKKKQFHAVVSCKGREYTPEQLADIAEKYVQKMGYGDNPYLIYSHSDTDNNHVHIVSTRVDKKGNKINDSMERVRSQQIMNEILSINPKEQVKIDISEALKYQFSTIAQFKMLLEMRGWKLSEKGEELHLWKGGDKFLIPIEKIKDRLENYEPNLDRRKQLTALFHKYKEGLNHLELQALMRNKFGVELVFHTGKGHSKPYGYTIIDYPNKLVMKGNEVMNISELLISPEKQAKIDSCNKIIEAILKDNKPTFKEFKDSMFSYGYEVSDKKLIKLKGEKEYLFKLNDKTLKELKYNGRLEQANRFNPVSKEEQNVLSRLFFVRSSDIQMRAEKDFDKLVYSEMMKSYFYNNVGDVEKLKEKEISFVRDKGEVYLIDNINETILNSRELDIHFDRSVYLSSDNVYDLERLKDIENIEPNNYERGILDVIESALTVQTFEMTVEEQGINKKKKKKKQQNQ
ncbi:relaxase/mobilization nuclease domain-containing protein [Capnocytophaga canis]|uniref:relaxase/mobilization nuclease domain-containing protein n=1 Tax=Capnocytophaga canis TaxID=1848903 RepID=UPI0018CFB230